jgi:DNA polymerase-3 subunit beta
MKIICTQENLQAGLSVVSSFAKKSVNLPILSNILIVAEKKEIRVLATNLEIGTTTQIRGKTEKEGKIAVPAQLFFNYVNRLPSTNIILELSGNTLNLACEGFCAQIKCSNPAEFPLIPQINSQSLCQIKSSELKDAISQVIFSAAKDESRPEIAGILLKISSASKKAVFELAATDSYRLSEKKITPAGVTQKATREFIVPYATLQELNRILPSEEADIKVFASENQIKFSFNGTELVSRLVEGRYPDYKRIIPENFSTKIKIAREDFLKALKSASLFSRPDTNEVNIEIDAKKGEVKVAAESRQVGSSFAKVPGEIEGKNERVTLNYQYILEGLSCLSSDEIFMMFSGDSGPALIKPSGDDSYIYIIMPIKK